MAHCVYLGHVVGNGQICLEQSKVEAVKVVSETKKQVHDFLGLTGYYCKFIPNYVQIATPLTDLNHKNSAMHVKLTSECSGAFTALKQLLCSSPVLQNPDFT